MSPSEIKENRSRMCMPRTGGLLYIKQQASAGITWGLFCWIRANLPFLAGTFADKLSFILLWVACSLPCKVGGQQEFCEVAEFPGSSCVCILLNTNLTSSYSISPSCSLPYTSNMGVRICRNRTGLVWHKGSDWLFVLEQSKSTSASHRSQAQATKAYKINFKKWRLNTIKKRLLQSLGLV